MQPGDDFGTTRWSLVIGAGRPAATRLAPRSPSCASDIGIRCMPTSDAACGDVSEAQDLTQEFFARLLEKNVIAAASRERGRFRAFLLAP